MTTKGYFETLGAVEAANKHDDCKNLLDWVKRNALMSKSWNVYQANHLLSLLIAKKKKKIEEDAIKGLRTWLEKNLQKQTNKIKSLALESNK